MKFRSARAGRPRERRGSGISQEGEGSGRGAQDEGLRTRVQDGRLSWRRRGSTRMALVGEAGQTLVQAPQPVQSSG